MHVVAVLLLPRRRRVLQQASPPPVLRIHAAVSRSRLFHGKGGVEGGVLPRGKVDLAFATRPRVSREDG